MFNRTKYRKIAKEIKENLGHQLLRMIDRGSSVDMYYSLENQLVEALLRAHENGRLEAKEEADKILKDFEDKSKDQVGS